MRTKRRKLHLKLTTRKERSPATEGIRGRLRWGRFFAAIALTGGWSINVYYIAIGECMFGQSGQQICGAQQWIAMICLSVLIVVLWSDVYEPKRDRS